MPKKSSIAQWQPFQHLLALWQYYLEFNDLGGEKMAGESKKGCGTIMARPSSFVSTSFSILFHHLTRQMAQQPLSLKKPFLSSQTLPVLTEWGSEGREKIGGKEPTEAFFNMAFCQFLCACQNERQCPVARLVGELLGKGWNLSVGKAVETRYWRGTPRCY